MMIYGKTPSDWLGLAKKHKKIVMAAIIVLVIIIALVK
jgi:hypothetical protein